MAGLGAERLIVLLANLAAEGLVVLVVAGGAAWALRRGSARSRQLLWGAALAGLLCLPFASRLVPGRSLDLLELPVRPVSSTVVEDAARPAPAGSAVGLGEAMFPAAALPMPHPAADADRSPTAPVAAVAAPAAASARELAAGRPDRLVPRAEKAAVAERFDLQGVASWAVAVWAAGAAACLGWLALGLTLAARKRRAARPLAVTPELEALLGEVGIARSPRLFVRLAESSPSGNGALPSASRSPKHRFSMTPSPMTWGWRRPVVLLPAAWRGWDDERRRVVLLHELVHVRRGDWLLRTAARLACALHWFNPLAWWALARLRVEQELSCDDAVLALGVRPSRYAAHLLAIARSLSPRSHTPAAVLTMARRSAMEGRLMSILDTSRSRRERRSRLLPALILVAGLIPTLAAVDLISAAESAPGGSELATTLAELEAVEQELAPFESELESLEARLEPLVEEPLRQAEEALEPHETRLEAIEAELVPYEERLEAIERDLTPFESGLEAIEAELAPYEERLEAIEEDLAPYEERLEAIEADMEPLQAELERIEEEMEPIVERLEAVSDGLEAAAGEGEPSVAAREELDRLHRELEPLHRRMEEVHTRLRPHYERMTAVHEEMRGVHDRMAEVHREMEPVYRRMEAAHREMEPVHRRMEEIHSEMRPVFEKMEAAHREMEPVHRRMEEIHRQAEPIHREMEEVHRRMRPVHQRMESLHRRLDTAVGEEIASLLAAELPQRPADEIHSLTRAVRERVSVRIDDGRLYLAGSAAELREAIGRELAGSADAATVDRLVRAILDFEVAAGS